MFTNQTEFLEKYYFSCKIVHTILVIHLSLAKSFNGTETFDGNLSYLDNSNAKIVPFPGFFGEHSKVLPGEDIFGCEGFVDKNDEAKFIYTIHTKQI